MPIISVAEANRRRAARAAAAQLNAVKLKSEAAAQNAAIELPFHAATNARHADESDVAQHDQASTASKGKKRRGHATKDENGKYLPTADYPEGFARPPEHSRFKPGGKPGPGRPKGSVSQEKILAKHLNQKREVTLDGKRQKLPTREILLMATVKAALEGKDKRARDYILAQGERLFAEKDNAVSALTAPALSASDQLSLAEFEAEMRAQILEELRGRSGAAEGEGL